MQGAADWVWDGYSTSVSSRDGDTASKTAFHADLIGCIHGLVGDKPVITLQDGRHIIQLPAL